MPNIWEIFCSINQECELGSGVRKSGLLSNWVRSRIQLQLSQVLNFESQLLSIVLGGKVLKFFQSNMGSKNPNKLETNEFKPTFYNIVNAGY